MADATGPQTANSSTSEARGSRASVFSSLSPTTSNTADQSLSGTLQRLGLRQCGLALVPLVCVDVQRTLFVDCSVGYNVNEEIHICWNLGTNRFPTNSHGENRTTVPGFSFLVLAGGQGSPAIMSLRTHLLGQIVFFFGEGA